jgi:hypothetical protein
MTLTVANVFDLSCTLLGLELSICFVKVPVWTCR